MKKIKFKVWEKVKTKDNNEYLIIFSITWWIDWDIIYNWYYEEDELEKISVTDSKYFI